jgi:hypothetical protein
MQLLLKKIVMSSLVLVSVSRASCLENVHFLEKVHFLENVHFLEKVHFLENVKNSPLSGR